MASSSHIAHDHHMNEPAAKLDSFMFDNSGLTPYCGDSVGLDDIDFIGYLALGPGPTLYPLYYRPMLHNTLTVPISLYAYVLTPVIHRSALETKQSTEVPIYIKSFHATNAHLNLPTKSMRVGPDNQFYVVYDCLGPNNPTTVVHLARHPTGYYPWSNIDFTVLAATSDAYNSSGVAIIPGSSTLMTSDDVTEADSLNDASMLDESCGNEHLIPGDPTSAHASQAATSNSPTIYSWISYSGNMLPSTAASTHQVHANHKSTPTSKRKKAKKAAVPEGGLKRVMNNYPKWKLALAYLRVLLRIAVCIGEIPNPHRLTFENRAEAIRNVWPWALLRANIDSRDLEEGGKLNFSDTLDILTPFSVLSLTTKTTMSHDDVLKLLIPEQANPSLSEFVYDTKRLVSCSISHAQAGFNLDDLGAGILLLDMIQTLLQQFIRPKSNVLPIRENGFAWFLTHQIAKEIMWHIVFRTTSTHAVRLVLADLEPTMFRNVDHPPFLTMSFLGSSCYGALLLKYTTLTEIPVDLLQYPHPAQVYEELCEMAVTLVHERNDEGHPELMFSLAQLCNIIQNGGDYVTQKSSSEEFCLSSADVLSAFPASTSAIVCKSEYCWESVQASPDSCKFKLATTRVLQLFRGNTIIMRGKNVATPYSFARAPVMSKDNRIQGIHIVPFDNSIKSLSDNIFNVYLELYFLEAITPAVLAGVDVTHAENETGSFLINGPPDEAAAKFLRRISEFDHCQLPYSLYTTASVLFESVDPHDLIALLDMSIREIAMQTQLQQEDTPSLATKLPLDAVDYEGVCQESPSVKFDCPRRIEAVQSKCMTWLSSCRKASLLMSSRFHDTTAVGNKASRVLIDPPQHVNVSCCHENLSKPGDPILHLPGYLKSHVDDMARRAYVSACLAEINRPLGTGTGNDNSNHFRAESKTLDELKYDFRCLLR
ncbi:uncharacterized protein F5147DRAFT_647038 [Suillus discolor]|uniref:Uncharacterized protein n=1 Tax=Suillus discolor TaxID=1912936 RepID=A0A9P7K1I0_9AGAM|nr:uncharacterized protein F5147DRAFT_647038 [Suillus discolor]KAG2120562.1 hypothetical protein F5147DRAFT_647038 [Suillus discolor]